MKPTVSAVWAAAEEAIRPGMAPASAPAAEAWRKLRRFMERSLVIVNAPCVAAPVVNGFRKVHAMHVPETNLLFFIIYPLSQDLRDAKCIQIDRILAQKVINRYFLFIVTAWLAQSRVS